MSFTDKLLLWLHIGFAIFTLGPTAAALLVTPRYIRKRDIAVLRYLYRTTRIFGALTAGVFLFGLLLGRHDFNQAWFTAAMTLFIVAAVMLVLVIFDQRKAITAIDKAMAAHEAAVGAPVAVSTAQAAEQREGASAGSGSPAGSSAAGDTAAARSGRPDVAVPADGPPADQRSGGRRPVDPADEAADRPRAPAAAAAGAAPRSALASAGGAAAGPHLASVERGRIATMGGVITLIWLVILVLMVWHR